MSAGVRLGVWSGPRNISTALMRSWENRPDCRVVDEPLYAFFLAETGIDHPGREEVIALGEMDWRPIVAELTAPVDGIYYQKQMAHHLIEGLPCDWIGELTNVILIRDPVDMVASYVRKRSGSAQADFGLRQLNELYEQLGGAVPVIDAADFLGEPELYLRWLCDHIGVEFTGAMLEWPAGSRESDGVWAKYWYDSVVASTSFGPYKKWAGELAPAQRRLVDELRPDYERLRASRLVLR